MRDKNILVIFKFNMKNEVIRDSQERYWRINKLGIKF